MRRIKLCLLLALLAVLVLTLTGCACKHEETTLVNIVNATCTEDGYSGDVQCTKCEEIVQEGSVVPATGHTPGEVADAVEATCTEDGFTGNVACTVCGEIITAGEAIPATGHTPGEPEGAVDATCTEDGMTGTVSCTVCGEVVTAGEAIPATGHTPGEPEGAVEATCTEDGATGTVSCTVCGEVITESEVIPAGHSYENNVCVRCGWRVPGLYVDGELTATWEQLVENGQITLYADRGQLQSVKGDLGMGTLVISEDVTYIAGIHNKTVKEIWVPATVTKMGAYILYGNTATETVRLFCEGADIPENALAGSNASFVTAE